MNKGSRRPLSLSNLRAFAAVARTLNFGAAAAELHVTQSAISRQIKGLEDELGAPLFLRGTRHVDIAPDGQVLLRAVEPLLGRLDASVQQIRRSRSRQRVNVTTFASFGSLWLLPRIEAFQRQFPDIDIRVSAQDELAELDDPEVDIALRYQPEPRVTTGATRLFDEMLSPVVSRDLWQKIRDGAAPPLAVPADLARHTLAEEDDDRSGGGTLTWQSWLDNHAPAGVQPRRWLYLTYTYQQVQAALAGHGVALARVPLVLEAIQRGELVEPFGAARRVASPFTYWMLTSAASRARPEVARFCDWVDAEAAATRAILAERDAVPVEGVATTPAAKAAKAAPVRRRRAR